MRISIRWPEIDVGVGATLAVEANPELCDEFVGHMPFGIVQSHPVVSGSSVTMWLPYLSKAPTPVKEAITDSPIGRIRLSQGTGSKLSIQYGRGLEPARQAVLGQIDDDDLDALPRVGREIWDNLYWRKQPLTVHFATQGDVSLPAPPPEPSHPLAREIAAAADAIQLTEPGDVARLRSGDVPDAGSFDQYFSVWVASYGLVRDFVVNTLYPVYTALSKHDLETVRAIYATVGSTYQFSLRYHGYAQLSDFAQRFQAVLEESNDPTVVEEVLDLEAGVVAAQVATLNALASLRAALGSLDRVRRVVKLRGYVSSTPEFDRHHLVTNGASDLIVRIFGPEAGAHVRTSVGVASLPLRAPVEIELSALLDG